MREPNDEILKAIVSRVEALRLTLASGLQHTGGRPPAGVAELEALGEVQVLLLNGFIKTVEQLEDQLARLFLTILHYLAVDTDGWFAQDTANMMEKLGIITDARDWVRIVKLRNRLVHDYPLGKEPQLKMIAEAYQAAGTLETTADRAIAFLQNRGWL